MVVLDPAPVGLGCGEYWHGGWALSHGVARCGHALEPNKKYVVDDEIEEPLANSKALEKILVIALIGHLHFHFFFFWEFLNAKLEIRRKRKGLM